MLSLLNSSATVTASIKRGSFPEEIPDILNYALLSLFGPFETDRHVSPNSPRLPCSNLCQELQIYNDCYMSYSCLMTY